VKKRINRMFIWDTALVIIFAVFMWIMLSIVRNNIGLITEDILAIIFMNTLCIFVLIFGSISLVAVFMHLRTHKERIYQEDIEHGEKY